jgi:hypothetical protein
VGYGADTIMSGPGNDTVRAGQDDGARDHVDCGSGNDRALIHAGDTAVNCESLDTVP